MTEIRISNPDKIVYPEGNIKKIDVINYYIDVCALMLPYVKDRLMSVIRCHDGVAGNCFFNKHLTSKDNVHLFRDKNEEYFYINEGAELIYLAQLGTIEFHIWGSDIHAIETPNLMVFDLDPDEKLPLKKLREGVRKVKSILDELNLKSFLKTSGGKGYHIVVPFTRSRDWNSFYDFSRKIAMLAESKWSEDFTTNIKKDKRAGKIFIDYLRNNRGSTCVAPFSLRARSKATISFPILWEDLDKIKPNEITIKNYKKYLNSAWKDFFDISQKLN